MKNVINRAIMAKKKMIFTLVLAIVSSVWMTNEASNWCMPSVRTLTNPWIEVNGTFQAEGFPCEPEPDEVCPTCLTIVLVTSNKTYYLVTDDGQLIEQLDTIPLGTKATVSGIPFEQGSYDYIQVSHIETDQTLLLPSLCDEWNILGVAFPDGYDRYSTFTQRLSIDTVIGGLQYVSLEQNGAYKGALREGTNRDIYYIPAGSTHEYLLYAFNAEVGDRLSNLWYGGRAEWCPNGYNATVRSISEGTPRVFTIEVEYTNSDSEGEHIIPYDVYWTEGVGLEDGPVGQDCPGPLCAGDYGQHILCAYENGQKIFESEYVEQFGCVFNGEILSAFEWHGIEVQGPEITGLTYELSGDTTISGCHFLKLYETRERGTRTYQGAVRYSVIFEPGRPMYYIPKDYVPDDDVFGGFPLQKFDVEVGDTVQAYSGMNEMPCEREALISYIVTDTRYIDARKHVYVKATGHDGQELTSEWIEGIGTPYIIWSGERSCHPTDGSTVIQYTLCAYNNGEQVYVSEAGEKYGCEYNYNPDTTHTDTIPLYARDDSGSSTVDPVDPNQIYATLTGDVLTVHNRTGAQVTFTLNNTSVNNVAARARKNGQPTSFTESISVELTEDGLYEIWLTSEEWNYTVFGTVNYIRSGTDVIKEDTTSATKKVLRGTQILIEREGKTYTLTGQEVK